MQLSMSDLIRIVEAANTDQEPHIDAHRSGSLVWIDMMSVPKARRGQGVGRAFYEKWEASLPKNIERVQLMAADTGSGPSNGFWDAMGFDYQYAGDELSYLRGKPSHVERSERAFDAASRAGE